MSRDPSLQEVIGKPLSKEEQAILIKRVEWASERLRAAKGEILKDIIDQDQMVEDSLTTMAAGGNILAEGLPGLAKTLTIKSIARATGLATKRIQFTPDLQPIDLTGSEVLNKKENIWELRHGPLFAQLVLADEINRAGAKTQAATLEAMEEKQVTIDGTTHALPRPFHLMATQNPVDQDGTSPITEAQADRFLMKVIFNYASRNAEILIALSASSTKDNMDLIFDYMKKFEETGDPQYDLTRLKDPDRQISAQQAFTAQHLIAIQKLARSLPVPEETVAAKAIDIVRALRPTPDNQDRIINENVEIGPSPRAEIAFLLAAKAKVLMSGYANHGQIAPVTNDLVSLMDPVLQHRIKLRYDAKKTVNEVLDHVRNKLQL